MAKKKAKHKFAHSSGRKGGSKHSSQPKAQSSVEQGVGNVPSAAPVVAAATKPTPAASTTGSLGISDRRWAYVGSDVRRIGLFLVGCVVLELIVAYLLDKTSVGTTIYNAINL